MAKKVNIVCYLDNSILHLGQLIPWCKDAVPKKQNREGGVRLGGNIPTARLERTSTDFQHSSWDAIGHSQSPPDLLVGLEYDPGHTPSKKRSDCVW